MAIKMADCSLLDEFWTHWDDETSVQTTYWVTGLFRFIQANPDKVEALSVPVDREHAEFMFEKRGVEQDRLEALVAAGPEAVKKPIVFIKLPNEQVLLVDGTHRYVLYFHLGAKWIPAYMVPWEIGKEFIVEDAPKAPDHETLMQHSHIATLRKLGLMS